MDDSSMNREIGERIREARTARKISQQELAASADLSLPHISNIENGKQTMKVQTLVKIIEVLQVSADSILRPNVPAVNELYQSELSQLVADCSQSEMEAIKQILIKVKQSFRAQHAQE